MMRVDQPRLEKIDKIYLYVSDILIIRMKGWGGGGGFFVSGRECFPLPLRVIPIKHDIPSKRWVKWYKCRSIRVFSNVLCALHMCAKSLYTMRINRE